MKLTVTRRHVPESTLFSGQNIHPIIARLYLSRGVSQLDQVSYQLSNLIRPDLLGGLKQAAEIIVQAIKANSKIVVVGDFDADGATSTALALRCLTSFGSKNHTYLVPNRFNYGYGLTAKLVDELEKMNAEIIVTVDNGISSVAGVEKAKKANMKVVVTDHHLPGAQLPMADAIVNPNMDGDAFPSKNLAGVGVLFYLMAEVRKHLMAEDWFKQRQLSVPNLGRYLDLVALGTVADVVPLDENNRIMIAQGLKQIRKGITVVGIQALMQVANRDIESADANSFSYVMAPRLNAAGRLQDMSIGIDLLLTNDMSKALELAQQLNEINQARKQIQEEMQRFADSVVQQLGSTKKLPRGVCLFHKDWHQGVVGLLASKIKEKTNRPVIAFARENEGSGHLKGSARSVDGLHIRDVLVDIDNLYPGLIVKYGGHAMAAGLTLHEEHLDDFQKRFNQLVEEKLGAHTGTRIVYTDGPIDSQDLCLDLAQMIDRAGPWGQHFETPLFDDWFVVYEKKEVGHGHTKLKLQTSDKSKKIDAIAFGVHPNDFPAEGQNTHVCYTPSINEFRGRRSLQLMVEHLVQ